MSTLSFSPASAASTLSSAPTHSLLALIDALSDSPDSSSAAAAIPELDPSADDGASRPSTGTRLRKTRLHRLGSARRRVEPVTNAALQSLLGAARGQPGYWYAIQLAGMAGLTAREIACLAAGDVEFHQGSWWLNIHALATGKPFRVDQGRKVPVAAQLVNDGFLDWVAHAQAHLVDGFLFPQWATAARPGDALHTWVRHQARRLFLTISLPGLRRSFAGALSQAGCSDRVLHRVLGLSHVSVLQTFGPTPSDDALAAKAVDQAVFPG